MVDELEVLDPQPLSNEIWETLVSQSFKPPSLANFDEHNDPYEHMASINTQMIIIRAPDFLKCKLLVDTFIEATLRWYMGLPRLSDTIYQDLVEKLVHPFAITEHQKLTTTSLFNVRHGPSVIEGVSRLLQRRNHQGSPSKTSLGQDTSMNPSPKNYQHLQLKWSHKQNVKSMARKVMMKRRHMTQKRVLDKWFL